MTGEMHTLYRFFSAAQKNSPVDGGTSYRNPQGSFSHVRIYSLKVKIAASSCRIFSFIFPVSARRLSADSI